MLESVGFWDGIETIAAGENWRQHAGIVTLPVWAGSQPRRLLQAMADKKRVITTPSSGLSAGESVTLIDEGDTQALIKAIRGVSP